MEVIDSILCEVGSWIMGSKELSLNDVMREWVICISSFSLRDRANKGVGAALYW